MSASSSGWSRRWLLAVGRQRQRDEIGVDEGDHPEASPTHSTSLISLQLIPHLGMFIWSLPFTDAGRRGDRYGRACLAPPMSF